MPSDGPAEHQHGGLAGPGLGVEGLGRAGRRLARLDPPEVGGQVAGVDRPDPADVPRRAQRRRRNRRRWPSRPGCAATRGRAGRSSRSRTSPAPRRRAGRSCARTSPARPPRRPARTWPGLPLLPEGGPLLVDQAVAREVRRARAPGRSPGRLPRSSGVEPGTPKIRSNDQRGNRGRTRSRARPTSSGAWFRSRAREQLGLERLGPEADPVHARRRPGRRPSPRRACRGWPRRSTRPRARAGTSGGPSPAAGRAGRRRAGSACRRRRRSCRPPAGSPSDRHLALEGRRGSGRPGGRRRPARRSRNSRTCGRRTGCGRTPRGQTQGSAAEGSSRGVESRSEGIRGMALSTVGKITTKSRSSEEGTFDRMNRIDRIKE